MIVTPYYNKTTQKGLVKYYEAMAGSVNIPVIVYSVAGRTGLNIKPETVAEIAKIDNVVAIKEQVVTFLRLLRLLIFVALRLLFTLVMMTRLLHFYL